jgi:2'-5' RNA ligase
MLIYENGMPFPELIGNILDEARKGPSWMIAACPDDKSIDKIINYANKLGLSKNKIYDKEELHCTLRYWSGANHKNKLEDVIDVMRAMEDSVPIECECFKLELLGGDTLTLRLKSRKLISYQKKIDELIQSKGVPKSTYPTFKAHISIAKPMSEIPEHADPNFKVVLSKFRLVEGDLDNLKWRL